MGDMRIRISWLAILVGLGLVLSPLGARAQLGDLPPAPGYESVPWPFGPRGNDTGGWYLASEFYWMKQSNPLGNQILAVRGLQDGDGSIGSALGLGATPGQFIGSGSPALNVSQVSGPANYQPGFTFTVGYRFEDGIALETKWLHLDNVKLSATAGLLPPGGNQGGLAQETFLTSFVYNFARDYFGPGNTTGVGSPTALAGIWDGSSQQTISFIQRFDQWELTMRVPIMDAENWRSYGIVGPRLVTMWERFSWTTIHPEFNGLVAPNDIAQYSNVTSNRLYGVHVGGGNDWFIGDTPIGAFSMTLDLQAALYLDLIKGRPRYELADRSTEATRARNLASVVPDVEAQFNVWYYPYTGIAFRFGYSAQAFFNTYGSPQPVDLNFGSITPSYESMFRLFDGFNAGLCIIF
jgi:hypothetical protein